MMDEIKKLTSKNFFKTLLTLPDTIKLIFQLERKYATYLMCLNIVTALIPLLNLIVYQNLINSIFSRGMQLVYNIIYFLILQIFTVILSQLEDYINGKFNMWLSYNINLKLIKKTTSLKLTDYEQSDMYNLIEKITQDSTYKPFQLFNAVIAMLAAFISLLTSLIFVAAWNIWIGLLLLVTPMLSLIIFLKVGQLEFLIQWKRASAERKSWYIVYLLTHDFSFKEIKLNNLSDYFVEEYKKLKKDFILQDLLIARKKAYFNSGLQILLDFINIFVICTIIVSVQAGRILIGNLVSLMQATTKINGYSQTIIQNIYIIYNTSLFMEQLLNFLKIENQSDYRKNIGIGDENRIKRIDLIDVEYKYPNSSVNALEKINFSIHTGELIAIIGENGSGKSTLVKLISGLYTPSKGHIYYNGIEDKHISTDFYQKNISILFQDFVKYELTLRENIGLGNIAEKWDDNKIIHIMDKLRLNFLKENGEYNLNLQLGTWFQNGRQLSGGQWQKIALARAFFKNASVYILDEPSAALDPISEKEIFDYFVNLSKDNISIFISHDLNVARKASKIIVMNKGRVVGIGTHEELLKDCSFYQELYWTEKYGRNKKKNFKK